MTNEKETDYGKIKIDKEKKLKIPDKILHTLDLQPNDSISITCKDDEILIMKES